MGIDASSPTGRSAQPFPWYIRVRDGDDQKTYPGHHVTARSLDGFEHMQTSSARRSDPFPRRLSLNHWHARRQLLEYQTFEYEHDLSEVPPGERDEIEDRILVGILIELDSDPVQWPVHYLAYEDQVRIQREGPTRTGERSVHARELHPDTPGVASAWRSIDLSEPVVGDDPTDVAVDVIIKETGRLDMDVTPKT